MKTFFKEKKSLHGPKMAGVYTHINTHKVKNVIFIRSGHVNLNFFLFWSQIVRNIAKTGAAKPTERLNTKKQHQLTFLMLKLISIVIL